MSGDPDPFLLDHAHPLRVRLLLTSDDGTPIRVDTVAKLATQGITGLAYIELYGGSLESPVLIAGSGAEFAEIRTSPSLIGRIDQAAPLPSSTRTSRSASCSYPSCFAKTWNVPSGDTVTSSSMSIPMSRRRRRTNEALFENLEVPARPSIGTVTNS